MNLNKVFETMSLEEEDVPINLPDLPQFSAVESNKLSIIGRILNPESQRMKDLILDMPRKWQVYGRVRGVALSPTMFQFTFKYEHDLEEVLRKRVWTFNEWSIVIDRWLEKPPDDYLKYLLVWVQLRNIPVNHYTKEAIEAFADNLGKVDIVAPVRKAKVFNLPGGDSVTIRYDFERVQKRCYHCQRLTHEKDKCPILVQERRDQAVVRRQKVLLEKQNNKLKLQRDDPLFGVLSDEQVGLDSATGRRKISPEVLQNMREYLLASEGSDRRVREERVKKSVMDLVNDPIGQRDFMRLEAPPIVTSEVNIDKGPVFDYSLKNVENQMLRRKTTEKSNHKLHDDRRGSVSSPAGDGRRFLDSPLEFFECSTGFSAGCSGANSSGTSKIKSGKRFRPPKKMRKFRAKTDGEVRGEGSGTDRTETDEKSSVKRRAECVAGEFMRVARRSKLEVVPNGGLPNQ
ncbi:uncharacterized protein LOC108850376 [Raphanus sativus]|uniref:Uncharacterized protein LOC108850376 n=1 Tax=Raphanus sativus TaxID=3726 RepID=A0A6J0N4P0_RAPSA|nr:uncharacterized protein LOC108850376 [Raphanus sativus]